MGSPNDPAGLPFEEKTDPSVRLSDPPLDDRTAPGFRELPPDHVFRDDATQPGFRDEPTSPTGFRDEPTAPAGTRTLRIQPTWMSAPDPVPRETRPRDPLMVPAMVFVAVLAASIAYVVLVQPAKHGPPAPTFTTSE